MSRPLVSSDEPSLHPAEQGRIEVADLSVRFGRPDAEVVALDGVDLTVAAGEFVAVLGPSGCGKSTLLNAIAGFERPAQGRVVVDGRTVTGPSVERPVVFQQHSLFPWMTALDNVAFGLRMSGRPDALARAQHYLELVGLAEAGQRYPHQLSGGMQQRVGLARALAVESRVLLMDEPFGALDAQTRLLMQEQLLSIWESSRRTVVFVTHDIDEAIFLADRVAVLGVRPNALRAVLPVELPRPRGGQEMRSRTAYQRLYQRLLGLIRDESLKTFEGGRA